MVTQGRPFFAYLKTQAVFHDTNEILHFGLRKEKTMSGRFALLTAVLFCSAIAAADILDQPHVAVYGTSEINVAPNEMNWRLTVRNEDSQLPAVAQKHTEIVNKVVTFLKGLNIDKDKLQTSRMQFGENWKYRNDENVKIGYYASTDVTFTIADLNLYEKLWMGLSQIEGVSIQDVEYGHSDRIRFQNESRQKALLAAKEKAAALAGTLGSNLGEVLKIEESAPQFRPMPYSNLISNESYDMGQAASMQVLEPGQITISTQVFVVFKLQN